MTPVMKEEGAGTILTAHASVATKNILRKMKITAKARMRKLVTKRRAMRATKLVANLTSSKSSTDGLSESTCRKSFESDGEKKHQHGHGRYAPRRYILVLRL